MSGTILLLKRIINNKGLVDLDGEISKCDKKLDLARLSLSKIVKFESQPDYLETVPENVRFGNEEKVSVVLMWLARVPEDRCFSYRGGRLRLRFLRLNWRKRRFLN